MDGVCMEVLSVTEGGVCNRSLFENAVGRKVCIACMSRVGAQRGVWLSQAFCTCKHTPHPPCSSCCIVIVPPPRHPDQPRAATITALDRLICQKLDRATFKRLMGPLEDVLRSNMEVRVARIARVGHIARIARTAHIAHRVTETCGHRIETKLACKWVRFMV